MRTIIIFLCFLTVLSACNSDQCRELPGAADIPVDLKIERLEKQLFNLKSKEEVLYFLKEHSTFSDLFLHREQYPNDSILANIIYNLIDDPHIDTLYNETLLKFGDLSDIKSEFENAFRNIKYFYPSFEEPEIKTAVTGFAEEMYISDSLLIIGLDYFIGKDATFRPVDLPEYILKRYQKEYLVPSIILLMSNQFNQTNHRNNTMMAEMIHYGKAYYFTKQVMPCTPDSLIIGYSAKEMADINENEDIIWANFLHNEVLYETSHEIKNKFLGERPTVYEIGNECPGRIGMWIGWNIVKEYMENNDVTLKELMQETDVQKIFNRSKYRPL